MKHKITRLLSILLALVMMAGLLPGQVAYADGEPPLQNVQLSAEGVLTWDAFSGAGCYFWSVGTYEGTTEETTFNIKGILDSNKGGSGTYTVKLYAMDKKPEDGGTRISSIWQKPYSYTSTIPQLSTPTNLKWVGNVGSWDSVPNATKYRGRLWVDSFGNTADPINFETTSNSIDFSDYFVADTHQYAFVVYATSENYIDSEYATSGWVTRTKDLSSLQNVSISSEGILTWDAFPGATLYSWSYQFGANSGGGLVEGTSVNIKHMLDEVNAPSGQYTIGLHALDKHPGYGGVQLSSKWWGEYDYVFSYVFTTQPQGGTITNGGQHTVTWATNFTPVSIHRFKDDATDKILDNPTITSENISEAGVYKYRAWYGTGAAEYVDSDEFTVNVTYTITFNASGGSASATNATTGTDGKLTSLPTATRDGYSFMGWFTQPNGGSKITTDTVFTGNTTVYARWSAKYHTITVNGGTADRSAAPPQQTVNITASTRENYTFKDWTVVSGGVTLENANNAATSFKMGTQDVLVRANYTYSGPTIDTVYINVAEPKAGVNPSDAVSAATDQYVISDTVWTDTETNIKLSATDKFVPGKTYKVKIYVRNVTSTIPFNTSAMTAYVNDSTDGVSINLGMGVIDVEKEFTVAAQESYNVHVNITTYDTDGVTLLSETGGTASASKNIAATGEKVTVTATPNSGYTLQAIKWGNGGTDTDITSTNEFIMKDFDVAVDVYFQKEGTVTPVKPTITTTTLSDGKVGKEYNQTLEATGDTPITWEVVSGSSLPAGLTLAADGKISGTPTMAVPYTFTVKATNGAGSDTKSYTVMIVAADATTYTVSFNPNSGGGTMNDVIVMEGEKLTLPECTFTPPSADKEFDKWDAGEPGDQVEIIDDSTITAIWKDKAVTPITVTEISIKTPASKTEYTVGEALDVSGLTLDVEKSDGTHETVAVTPAMVSGFDSSAPAASQTLTITYEGKTVTYNVSIKAPVTPPSTITYTVTVGGNSTWTKGSTNALSITVKRSEDDENCIKHFTGVEIDGTALSDSDYDKKKGSTIVTLKAASLQKLSVGEHTVTVNFDDGKVSTKLTVANSTSGGNTGGNTDPSGTNTGGNTNTGSNTNKQPVVNTGTKAPATGDNNSIALWSIMLIASLLGISFTMISRKRYSK